MLLDEPTYRGIQVPARVVGALLVRAADSEPEPKLICVAVGDPTFAGAHRLEDLPGHLAAEIEQFFAVCKQLEDRPHAQARQTARRQAGAAPPRPAAGQAIDPRPTSSFDDDVAQLLDIEQQQVQHQVQVQHQLIACAFDSLPIWDGRHLATARPR